MFALLPRRNEQSTTRKKLTGVDAISYGEITIFLQWLPHHHTTKFLELTGACLVLPATPSRCSQPAISMITIKCLKNPWPARSCRTPCRQLILTTQWLGQHTERFTSRCAATSVRRLCKYSRRGSYGKRISDTETSAGHSALPVILQASNR